VTKRGAQSGPQEKTLLHDRKYRGGKSHPLPLWNGILEHCEKIGPALWEFVWLLDKITVEKDGKGIVLGGAPVKIERIARELDRSDRTVRSNLDRLQDGKYIERTRTPYGLTIRVRNSRKFGIWSKKEIGRKLPISPERPAKTPGEIGRKLPERSAENCRNKEDSANNTADAVAVGSVGGLNSIVPSAAAVSLDRRHPPSEDTSKSDDDDRERNRHRLKEKALSRFQEKHPGVESYLVNLWLDTIEERAKSTNRKIESENYFLRGLENEFSQHEESAVSETRERIPAQDSANGNSYGNSALLFWTEKFAKSVAVSVEKAREKVLEVINEKGHFKSWKQCRDFCAQIRTDVFPRTPEPREDGQLCYFPDTVLGLLDLVDYSWNGPTELYGFGPAFNKVMRYLVCSGKFESSEERRKFEARIANAHEQKKDDEERRRYRDKVNRRNRERRAERKSGGEGAETVH